MLKKLSKPRSVSSPSQTRQLMPTVTEITQQKRDSSRYNIEVDGQFAFALSANALIASGLFKGQQLTTEELANISQAAHSSRAYDQAIGYLSLRKRSRREVEHYLTKKNEYDAKVIAAAIERLESVGLISDSDFASAWIADRKILKPRSRRVLAQELRQKGLTATEVEQALLNVSDEDEVNQIKAVIQKKATRYPDRQKLITYLGSLGYGYDLIKRALQEETEF